MHGSNGYTMTGKHASKQAKQASNKNFLLRHSSFQASLDSLLEPNPINEIKYSQFEHAIIILKTLVRKLKLT